MQYISNPQKLASVIKTLAQHEDEVERYFVGELKPRLAPMTKTEEKLWVLYAIANSDRRTGGRGNDSLKKATASFHQGLPTELRECQRLLPKDAHQHFWKWLCDIEGMNQKTANLLLKFIVTMQKELRIQDVGNLSWHSWKPFLHVPLDMWVLKLMGTDYLAVCNAEFEKDFRYKKQYVSPDFRNRKYVSLQNDIEQVAQSCGQPAIVLDMLWFVGNKYCSHYNLFCNICWLGKEACSNFQLWQPEVQSVGKSKSDKRKEKEEEHDNMRTVIDELYRLYVAENLGKTKGDFYTFTATGPGKKWLNQHMR